VIFSVLLTNCAVALCWKHNANESIQRVSPNNDDGDEYENTPQGLVFALKQG